MVGGGGRGVGGRPIGFQLIVFPAQVVKLHTKLGKPIPSTEPSMVAQTSSSSSSSASSSTTASSSKTTAAPLSSSSQCLSSGSASSSSYLKPVSMVSGGGSMGVKNPSVGSLSAATAAKKVNAPKINFVGA